jgi:hypothetical protein
VADEIDGDAGAHPSVPIPKFAKARRPDRERTSES